MIEEFKRTMRNNKSEGNLIEERRMRNSKGEP